MYLGYCLPMDRAMFTKVVNSLSQESVLLTPFEHES